MNRVPFRAGLLAASALAVASCASLPSIKHTKYAFPKNAFVGDVKREYSALGPVRSRVDYPTLDPNSDEKVLCRNYFNKAVKDLLKYAKQQGADAVIDVRSVVFYDDGSRQTFQSAECSDDGEAGQVLAQGIAVRWKSLPDPVPQTGTGAWDKPPGSPKDESALAQIMEREKQSGATERDAQAAPAAAASASAAAALAPRDFSSVPVLGGELPPPTGAGANVGISAGAGQRAPAQAEPQAQSSWPSAEAAPAPAPAPAQQALAPPPGDTPARIEMQPAAPLAAAPDSQRPRRKRRTRRTASQDAPVASGASGAPGSNEETFRRAIHTNRPPRPTDSLSAWGE